MEADIVPRDQAALALSRDAVFVRVAESIREDILSGELLSGTSLIETDLARTYGVSRNTIREALQLLRHQGLVSQEPNKSVRVKRLTVAELKDIFIVRRVVELSALRGRSSVPKEWLARLNGIIQNEAEAISLSDWRQAGTQSLKFHQEIVALHGSARFDQMFELLVTQLRLVFVSGKGERAFQEPWLAREAEIYNLLQTGDCEQAAERLEDYLIESEQMLSAMFKHVPRFIP